MLSIGARFVSEETAQEAIERWLTTPFDKEEKRVRRNQKIEQVTKRNI
jgi:ribose 5-phosphate isomerase RpiB